MCIYTYTHILWELKEQKFTTYLWEMGEKDWPQNITYYNNNESCKNVAFHNHVFFKLINSCNILLSWLQKRLLILYGLCLETEVANWSTLSPKLRWIQGCAYARSHWLSSLLSSSTSWMQPNNYAEMMLPKNWGLYLLCWWQQAWLRE